MQTHIQPDTPDGADFMLRQWTQDPIYYFFFAGLLSGLQNSIPRVNIDFDFFGVVRCESNVQFTIDRFTNQDSR
jgi:hypothetical protein